MPAPPAPRRVQRRAAGLGLLGAAVAAAPAAARAEESALTSKLLARSAENKARNDAERYEKTQRTYDSYFAVERATSAAPPKDVSARDSMGFKRPWECDLGGVFSKSELCRTFDGDG